MADQLQLRGGTTVEHSTFTGALREVTVDIDKDTVVVHDNTTAGGHPLLREDGSNSALSLGSAATPSLKFTGDTNTGIYSPGADQIAISTAGTGRLFVDSSGNVGVGTTSPGRSLHIAGGTNSIVIERTDATTSALLCVAGNNQTEIYSRATNSSSTARDFTLNVGSSEALRVDTSKRLLVGTSTAPTSSTNLDANFGAAVSSGEIASIGIGTGGYRIFNGLVPESNSSLKTTTATFQFADTYGAALIEIDIVGGLAQVALGRYLLMVDCDTASGQTAQLTGGSSIQDVLSSGWNTPVFTASGASSTPTFTVAFTRSTGVDTESWANWLRFTAKVTSNSAGSAPCVLTSLTTS